MAITDQDLEQAIELIATIKDIDFNIPELVEDIVLLAEEYPTKPEFKLAVREIKRSIENIKKNPKIGHELERNYSDWWSHVYKPQSKNGFEPELRTVYQDRKEINGTIRIRGFGHRWNPESIYKRLQDR